MVLHMMLLRWSCREIFMILMFQGHNLQIQELIFQLASHRFLVPQCHNSLLHYRDMGGVLFQVSLSCGLRDMWLFSKLWVPVLRSFPLHILLTPLQPMQPVNLDSVLIFQGHVVFADILDLHLILHLLLIPYLLLHLVLLVVVLNPGVSLRGCQTMMESPVGLIIWSNLK